MANVSVTISTSKISKKDLRARSITESSKKTVMTPSPEFHSSNHEMKYPKASEELSFSVSEEEHQRPTLKGEDIQALAIRTEDLEKLRLPKPPKEPPRPVPMTRVLVRKTRPADEVRNAVQVAVARPLPMDMGSQPLDYTGPGGPRFDDQGMVLPHSILGSLEDFRRYLEAKGETELVRCIPETQRERQHDASGQHRGGAEEKGPGLVPEHRDIQSHALQHWRTHMRQRQRQQDFLSSSLHRPVDSLLMNQANGFRQTQEQRELISRGLPAVTSGYGYRVGSEFWSVPQRFGDELSGITATLTQTQRGQQEPVTHVGQPSSVRQESGNVLPEALHSYTRTWDQSVYLQHQRQKLQDLLKDLDFNQPEVDGLEVIGSGKPFTYVTVCRSPLMEEEKEDEEKPRKMEQENLDPLGQYDDVLLDGLLIPALRLCGQPAHWTGSSTSHQGEVGIRVRVNFEALTGERAYSHLELHNEGSTAIYYSWQQLPRPSSFPELQRPTTAPHFYFNSSTGVILPGDTQRVELIFKSEAPGIKTELWQLNTHPVLLGGASMQVTLRGVALYQDRTAHQRLDIERDLEKRVAMKVCRSVVNEVLRGVRTPERPSSPAELNTTEEEEFLNKNPKLLYHYEPVEALKRLWQVVAAGSSWDLSIDTLRQAVLTLPEEEAEPESAQPRLTRDRGLAQINTLLLELSHPLLKHTPLTPATVGRQLWRELLDRLSSEAMWLRQLLGLPDTDTWTQPTPEPHTLDPFLQGVLKREEKSEKKGGAAAKEEKRGESAKKKDDKKGALKLPTKEKPLEEHGKKRGKGEEEGGRHAVGNQGKEPDTEPSLAKPSPETEGHQPRDYLLSQPELTDKYRRLLHHKVYALMEGLVDSLFDLVDELTEGQTLEQ